MFAFNQSIGLAMKMYIYKCSFNPIYYSIWFDLVIEIFRKLQYITKQKTELDLPAGSTERNKQKQ